MMAKPVLLQALLVLGPELVFLVIHFTPSIHLAVGYRLIKEPTTSPPLSSFKCHPFCHYMAKYDSFPTNVEIEFSSAICSNTDT